MSPHRSGEAPLEPRAAASPHAGLMAERLALIAVFLAVVVLVDPRGDFPLNDDWDFAAATWNLARTGDLELTRYTAVSLRLQVVWGALWTVALGESFEVLRASTLVLSLGTVLLLHALLARMELGRWGRVCGALALLTHPVFLWSSFTFMTEIPFLFLGIASLFAFARGWSERRGGLIGAGAIAAAASFFVRQTGLAHAGGPVLLGLLGSHSGPRRRMLAAGLVLVVVFAGLFLTTTVLRPPQFSEHASLGEGGAAAGVFAVNLAQYTIANVQLSLLFFLPLSLAAIVSGSFDRRFLVFAALVAAVFVFSAAPFFFAGAPERSPFLWRETRLGNLLVNWGLGPATLYDTSSLGLPLPRHLGIIWRGAFTLAVAGLASLALARTWRDRERLLLGGAFARAAVLLGVGNMAVASALLAMSVIYLDRYALSSLWPTVLILAGLIRWDSRAVRLMLLTGLLLVGTFGISGAREYLAWNRARWTTWELLRQRGIPASAIDGGYEANSWSAVWSREGLVHGEVEQGRRRWVLSFRPLPDTEIVARVAVPGGGAVYALDLGPSDQRAAD